MLLKGETTENQSVLYVLGDKTSLWTYVTIADDDTRSACVHCTVLVLTPSVGTVLVHVLRPTHSR